MLETIIWIAVCLAVWPVIVSVAFLVGMALFYAMMLTVSCLRSIFGGVE